jgi:hypothetical protein
MCDERAQGRRCQEPRRGEPTRRTAPLDQLFPFSWRTVLWILYFGVGLPLFILGLSLILNPLEHHPVTGVVLIAIQFVFAVPATVLERRREKSHQTRQ